MKLVRYMYQFNTFDLMKSQGINRRVAGDVSKRPPQNAMNLSKF